jgi:hypothetical protein
MQLHYPGQEAGGSCRGAQTLRALAELEEEPNPPISPTLRDANN